MILKKFGVLLFGLIISMTTMAVPEPQAMLEGVSQEMVRELNKHIKQLKHDDQLVYNLVAKILAPHFDLLAMARVVVGREYWRQASAATQQQFVKEFTHYIIRVYAAAIQLYDGEKIKFFTIRGAIRERVQVDSELLLKNGPPVQIQYRLQRSGGKWLIYDFSVDGVSIVKNYYAQFAAVLRQGGLQRLVTQLQHNNRR